jgi:hypothetical protein
MTKVFQFSKYFQDLLKPKFNPNFIFVRTNSMKIYKTTDPTILNLFTRLLKLIEMIDADPKLLFGTLFYSLLLLVYLVGTL